MIPQKTKIFLAVFIAAFLSVSIISANLHRRFSLELVRGPFLTPAGTSKFIRSDDPQLIYRLHRRAFPGQVNSYGYMDREHPLVKPEGTFRIVVIGDSIAAGDGVGVSGRFSSLLEKALNEYLSGGPGGKPYSDCEVINLAVTGYSTVQELAVLETLGMKFDPDLVLWEYCLNDPAHPVYHNAGGNAGAVYGWAKYRLAGYLAKYAYLLREAVVNLFWIRSADYHIIWHYAYTSYIERQIDRVYSLTSGSGDTEVLFVIFPLVNASFDQPVRENRYEKIYERLEGWMSEGANCNAINLLSSFKNKGIKRQDINQSQGDPWHLNSRGHELTAQIISDYIIRKYLR